MKSILFRIVAGLLVIFMAYAAWMTAFDWYEPDFMTRLGLVGSCLTLGAHSLLYALLPNYGKRPKRGGVRLKDEPPE